MHSRIIKLFLVVLLALATACRAPGPDPDKEKQIKEQQAALNATRKHLLQATTVMRDAGKELGQAADATAAAATLEKMIVKLQEVETVASNLKQRYPRFEPASEKKLAKQVADFRTALEKFSRAADTVVEKFGKQEAVQKVLQKIKTM